MNGRKWIRDSKILGRRFHLDVFESTAKPKGIVLWFGGSGTSKDIYTEREKTVVPIFEKSWSRLGQDLPIIFVFITAPYDIKFADPSNFNIDKDRWNQHVEKEILDNWPNLPVYLIGNSAGCVLAFNGIHTINSVVGAGGIGGDQIPADLDVPLIKNGEPKWTLDLFYNINDPVYEYNLLVIDRLLIKGLAKPISRYDGSHDTSDYINNKSFDKLIYLAIQSF